MSNCFKSALASLRQQKKIYKRNNQKWSSSKLRWKRYGSSAWTSDRHCLSFGVRVSTSNLCTLTLFFGRQVDHARLPKLEQEHKLVLSRAKLLESKCLTLEDANKSLHESTVKQQHELAQLALQLQESAHKTEIQASQSQRNLDLELQKCRQSVSAELHEAQNALVSLVVVEQLTWARAGLSVVFGQGQHYRANATGILSPG